MDYVAELECDGPYSDRQHEPFKRSHALRRFWEQAEPLCRAIMEDPEIAEFVLWLVRTLNADIYRRHFRKSGAQHSIMEIPFVRDMLRNRQTRGGLTMARVRPLLEKLYSGRSQNRKELSNRLGAICPVFVILRCMREEPSWNWEMEAAPTIAEPGRNDWRPAKWYDVAGLEPVPDSTGNPTGRSQAGWCFQCTSASPRALGAFYSGARALRRRTRCLISSAYVALIGENELKGNHLLNTARVKGERVILREELVDFSKSLLDQDNLVMPAILRLHQLEADRRERVSPDAVARCRELLWSAFRVLGTRLGRNLRPSRITTTQNHGILMEWQIDDRNLVATCLANGRFFCESNAAPATKRERRFLATADVVELLGRLAA